MACSDMIAAMVLIIARQTARHTTAAAAAESTPAYGNDFNWLTRLIAWEHTKIDLFEAASSFSTRICQPRFWFFRLCSISLSWVALIGLPVIHWSFSSQYITRVFILQHLYSPLGDLSLWRLFAVRLCTIVVYIVHLSTYISMAPTGVTTVGPITHPIPLVSRR